jgi:amino acid transporter
MTPSRNVKSEIYRYKKRAEIMGVICHRHLQYYKKINNFFTSVLIFVSTFVSVFNSIQETVKLDAVVVKLITICLSSIITIIVSFSRVFKWEAKTNEFSKGLSSFNKMGHTINQKIISQDYDMNFLESLIVVYENTVEGVSESFKGHIIKDIKQAYTNIAAEYTPSCLGIVNTSLPSMTDIGEGNSSPNERRNGPLVPRNSFSSPRRFNDDIQVPT